VEVLFGNSFDSAQSLQSLSYQLIPEIVLEKLSKVILVELCNRVQLLGIVCGAEHRAECRLNAYVVEVKGFDD